MASEQVLIARFQADLSGLNKGVAEASSAIQRVPEQVEKSNQKTTKSTVNLKKALQDVGQTSRRVGTLIGGTFGDLVFYIGEAASAIKGVAGSLIRFLGPGGLIAGGFAAATAAGGFFISRLRDAAIEAKLTAGSVKSLTEAIKKLQEQQSEQKRDIAGRELNIEGTKKKVDELKTLVANLEKAGIKSQVPELNAQIRDLEKVLAGANTELGDAERNLDKLGQALVEKRLAEVTEKLSVALLKAERAYRTGGDELDYLNEQLDAYTQAKKDALEIEGLHDDAVTEFDKSIKGVTQSIEAATQRYQEMEQAKEDALLPTGSFSPVDQPTGLIESLKGPQTVLPQEQEISDLVIALKEAQAQIQVTAITVGRAIGDTFQTLAAGIGDAVAASIVYGASLAEGLMSVLKAVAAQIISALIQLGVQQLINLVLNQVVALKRTVAELSSYAAITYAAAFSATAAIPIVGPALAPGAAAAAVAGMLAGASGAAAAGAAAGSAIGTAAFAEGGIVTGPVLGLVGEAGPEVILPLSRLGDMNGGDITIHNYITLDGKVAAKSVTRHQPGVLRRKIGNRF